MLLSLSPDRVALYGYAHVPWMAKRQAMIPTEALPSPEERLALFETARRLFLWDSYQEIGIDHFAKTEDSMAVAVRSGHLRRNFQGYTDDTCEVLLRDGRFGHFALFRKGMRRTPVLPRPTRRRCAPERWRPGAAHALQGARNRLRSRMIEMLMCDFRIDADKNRAGIPPPPPPACRSCSPPRPINSRAWSRIHAGGVPTSCPAGPPTGPDDRAGPSTNTRCAPRDIPSAI